MHGDYLGNFVFGYWGLKGKSVLMLLILCPFFEKKMAFNKITDKLLKFCFRLTES